MKYPVFFLLFFILCCGTGVQASRCSLIDEQGHVYLVLTSENPIQVSAFTVQMNTTGPTQIQDIIEIAPFSIFSNTDLSARSTTVSGFVGNPAQLPAPGTSLKLAEVNQTGDVKNIAVVVLVMEDAGGNAIPVDNSIPVPAAPVTTVTLPPYQSEPRYLSPNSQPGVIPAPPQNMGPVSPALPGNPGQGMSTGTGAGITPERTASTSGNPQVTNGTGTNPPAPLATGFQQPAAGQTVVQTAVAPDRQKPLAGELFVPLLSLVVIVVTLSIRRKM